MTVIINKKHDVYQRDVTPDCSSCGARTHYPFLEWIGIGSHTIYLCARCCHVIQPGLTADLIHVSAIQELQKASSSRDTFIRGAQ